MLSFQFFFAQGPEMHIEKVVSARLTLQHQSNLGIETDLVSAMAVVSRKILCANQMFQIEFLSSSTVRRSIKQWETQGKVFLSPDSSLDHHLSLGSGSKDLLCYYKGNQLK